MAQQTLIDPGFFSAMARLTSSEQARVVDFINLFYANPAQPSIQLHAIDATRSKGLWSGRVTQDLRVILYKDGDTWVLLYIDHHDPAYRWAERRDIGRHPVTGVLQIVETVETIREVEKVIAVPTQAAASPRFAEHTDAYLLSLGVPPNWLPTVRMVSDDDQLLVVSEKLPAEVGERLLSLAAGEFVTPPPPLAQNQPLTASSEARRHFYVVEDAEGLAAALAAPLDRWIAFLHPAQRAIVEADGKGPMKVTGAAGTGKTVVAMHRARFLSRRGQRVLLTSFVSTLCENLARNLRKLCTAAELAHITVSTVHKQALDLVRRVDETARPATEQEIEALLEQFTPRYAPDFDAGFVHGEWSNVIQLQGIISWAEYRSAKRTGRGRPLSVTDRKNLWRVFEDTYARLAERHHYDWASLCRKGEQIVAQGLVASPFDAVIIDETQDLKPAELRFLRTLCAGHPGQMLLAGDAGQRIYPGGFSLGALGIDVRGRSHVLRINYRTTEQIRRLADRLLGPNADDLDGDQESRKGTRSLLRGPQPTLQGFDTAQSEVGGAVDWIKARLASGLKADELACFARTSKRIDELRTALTTVGINSHLLADGGEDDSHGVHLGTMHRAKGLEYKAVLVLDCSASALPNPTALKGLDDPLDRELAEARERQLLYVAMTRARDELHLSWSGTPSRFVLTLQNRETA